MDAPVSGGPKGAANGRLAIWIGGDRSVYDRYTDVLGSISDDARYVGPIGAGTIAKLTHNMASIALNAVVVEVLTMGVKAGVEPVDLWEAIRNGAAGRQRSFDNVSRRFLQESSTLRASSFVSPTRMHSWRCSSHASRGSR